MEKSFGFVWSYSFEGFPLHTDSIIRHFYTLLQCWTIITAATIFEWGKRVKKWGPELQSRRLNIPQCYETCRNSVVFQEGAGLFELNSFFWWRHLVAGRSLKYASCRGGWGERSCPRSATAIHSVAADRTPNLPIGRRTLKPLCYCRPNSWLWLKLSVVAVPEVTAIFTHLLKCIAFQLLWPVWVKLREE